MIAYANIPLICENFVQYSEDFAKAFLRAQLYPTDHAFAINNFFYFENIIQTDLQIATYRVHTNFAFNFFIVCYNFI